MHASELVELAALVATHGRALLFQVQDIPAAGMEEYWSAAKCRLDRWSRSLKQYSLEIPYATGNERVARWRTIRPVLEEILSGEVLTRVWSAVVCTHDRLRGRCEVEPVARSIYIGHLEARNRALNILVYGQGFAMEEAVTLNRLRRGVERWTDLLLAHLYDDFGIDEFAFVPERAEEFSRDLRDEARAGGGIAWQLVLASLRAAFPRNLSRGSPSSDLNQRIAAGVLRCFDSHLFDSTGLAKSLWMVRMETAASDTAGMIDELLAIEEGPFSPTPFPPEPIPRSGTRF
ncbi:MAG: hypothetical protein RIC55_30485 [Pirellulaceae bacterium]